MNRMNEPTRHHYVPVFYLSRWKDSDECICRFSRPFGSTIKVDQIAPKATAFEPGLYETHGLPPDQAQAMERDFMAKIDNDAAMALTVLEKGPSEKTLTMEIRNNWSRFLVAQMLRAPRDIAQLKKSVQQEWNKEAMALEGFQNQQNPANADELVFDIARLLMEHPQICSLLNGMYWRVLDVPQEADLLLTSDNPVWMTSTLVNDDDFLVVPISPRKIFAATMTLEMFCRLQAQQRGTLVKSINTITVQHAVKFVYGQTEDSLPLVQEHMSSRRHSTWLERLAAIRGHEIVAHDSPMRKPD
jgi:hypothetical protein